MRRSNRPLRDKKRGILRAAYVLAKRGRPRKKGK